MEDRNPGLVARAAEAALGIAQLTRDAAEQLVSQAQSTGTQLGEDPSAVVEQLLERQRRTSEMVASLARTEVQRVLRSQGVPANEDVEALRDEVDFLRDRVDALESRLTAGES